MGIGSYKKKVEAIDHHDLPTEPLPLLIPTLPTEISPDQAHPFDYASIPAPSHFVPMSSANTPGYPVASSAPVVTVYPDGSLLYRSKERASSANCLADRTHNSFLVDPIWSRHVFCGYSNTAAGSLCI